MPYAAFPPARLPLRAVATQRAQARMDDRLRELKELAFPLALLDREVPALEALGLTVEPEAINLARERVGDSHTLRAVLRLYTGGPLNCPIKAQRWIDALCSLGFEWVSQHETPYYPSVLLRKHTLHVRIDVPRSTPVQTPAAQQSQPQPAMRQAA